MSSSQREVLVIGLPASGKTTFLAALWEVLSSSGGAPSLFRLKRFEGDQRYLNLIRELWADCNELPRTRTSDEEVNEITLERLADKAEVRLTIPDLSGETFSTQWAERTCSPSYYEMVGKADGALLFLNPGRVTEGTLIRDATAALAAIGLDQGPTSGPIDTVVSEFSPHGASLQVILVDLLQTALEARSQDTAFRLGIVISAWDRVSLVEARTRPDKWAEQRMPLLWQFLTSRSSELPVRVFGVSAQGGELADASQLRKAHRPTDRIQITDGDTLDHDLSRPIDWVLTPATQ